MTPDHPRECYDWTSYLIGLGTGMWLTFLLVSLAQLLEYRKRKK